MSKKKLSALEMDGIQNVFQPKILDVFDEFLQKLSTGYISF